MRSPRPGLRAPRLVLAVLALLAGLASPVAAVLHGVTHARERQGETLAVAAQSGADRTVVIAARASDAAGRGADRGPHDALGRGAFGDLRPTVDLPSGATELHLVLHTQVVAKVGVDLHAVLPARAPPTVATILAAAARRPIAASRMRPPGRALSSSAQPRAPPLG